MNTMKFTSKDVYKFTSQFPRGQVSTYGALASALKSKRASRAIGQILKANPTPIVVPCHRVVKSDGSVGGYGGSSGSNKKIRLLRSEGILFKKGRVQDIEKVIFTNFTS